MSILTVHEKRPGADSVIVAGGLDPSGGAGLAADIMAVQAAGVLALPIATTLTVQDSSNSYGYYPVDAEIIQEQLAAVMKDFKPAIIKIGLSGSAAVISIFAKLVDDNRLKLVLDPVVASSSEARLADALSEKTLAELLIPKAFLVTPNALEVLSLTGVRVKSEADVREAAERLKEMGAENVLIKGGHIIGDSEISCIDYLYNEDDLICFEAGRKSGGRVRGTGCHLASSIAAHLAKGKELPEAVEAAKEYVTNMITRSVRGGRGARQALAEAQEKRNC
jgi:hydroxymethylpyrimidine kinase/phosphomethylpyrimidine kinase